MADRFPLIVNAISKKIEEIVAGDNLELTGNGLIISGDTGAGKYLTSDGATVFWGDPGNVYLTQSQTLTNKTLESSIISGSNNTITNIPNSALINSGITINGSTIALGGTVTTPDNNTTYTIAAVDGASAARKIIRLTSGGNAGSGIDDDITLIAGTNVTLDRSNDDITINSSYVDTDTITTLQSAVGGSAQSGAITIAASGSSTVSQNAGTKTITISSSYIDTITRLRATAGQVFSASDFTFLDGGATTVTQSVDGNGDPTITYSSVDTITRIKGGGAGSFVTGDTTFTGGTNVTVSQAGNIITVDSVDTNTVTRLSSGGNAVASGDFNFTSSGATSLTQTTVGGVTTINISSANDDTGASLQGSGGLILQGTDFQIKNYNTFSGNTLMKWDSGNDQLTDSIITDNGSTVTITGDLVVEGTQTILNVSTLQVEDNDIELRKGNNLTGTNGGITLNRTTDSSGNITSYVALQWNESVGYWRSWDGSVEKRFVTEGETQVLTNKTLTSPTLTAPVLGSATATSINGLVISSTASATLDIASSKTLDVDRDLSFTSDNNSASINVNFRQGGNVAYTSDTLASFSSTTSTQIRGLITDTTGTGRLVFQDSPTFLTSLNTTSTGFTLFNSSVTNVTAFGAAGIITMGQSGGTMTVNQSLVVNEDLTVGTGISDTITFNGTVNSENADILIRGTATDPMSVGRGGGAVSTNTRVGVSALQSNTSGSQNIALGYQALFTNNSGAANTAVGNRALRANGVGSNNIGIGRDVLLVNLEGSKNVAMGNNALESNTSGDSNVCIGHYAGFDVLGSGNVLIGPAYNENSGDVTFRPPSVSGDNQLVIGSGGQAWVRGDSNFDVTFNNDVTVDQDVTIKGNLTVNGIQTIVKSNIVQITDKNIELASIVSTQFVASATDGTADITSINPTAGLIPGMEVTTSTAGFTVPSNTIIVSISGNTATLSNNIAGNGQITLTAIGPSDSAAEDGGIIVKGSTDKSILWKGSDAGVTYNSWVSSEHFDLASGKYLSLDAIRIADPNTSTIGPNNGTTTGLIDVTGGSNGYNLGSAVVGAAATSFNFTGTGEITLPNGDTAQRNSSPLNGMLRYNGQTNVFEGYSNGAWGSIAIGGVVAGTLSVSGAGSIGGSLGVGGANPASYNNLLNGLVVSRGGTNEGITIDCSNQGGLFFVNGTSSYAGQVIYYHTPGDESMRFLAQGEKLRLEEGGAVLPGSDNTQDLGSTTKRWANIYSAGNLKFSTAGTGIDFSATANAAGMTSEVLDDYEEGTWTPSLISGYTSPSYGTQEGTYTKIGRLVFIRGVIRVSDGTTTTGFGVQIGGLPYSAGSTGQITVTLSGVNSSANHRSIFGSISGNSQVDLYYQGDTSIFTASGSSIGANFLTFIRFSGTYSTS